MHPSSRFPAYVQVHACSSCCVCLLTLFIFETCTWFTLPSFSQGPVWNRLLIFFFLIWPGHYKHLFFFISERSWAKWKCAFLSLIIVNSLNFRKRPVNSTVSISCGTNKDFLNMARWACPHQSFRYNIDGAQNLCRDAICVWNCWEETANAWALLKSERCVVRVWYDLEENSLLFCSFQEVLK